MVRTPEIKHRRIYSLCVKPMLLGKRVRERESRLYFLFESLWPRPFSFSLEPLRTFSTSVHFPVHSPSSTKPTPLVL
jgi:hypothetical protein